MPDDASQPLSGIDEGTPDLPGLLQFFGASPGTPITAAPNGVVYTGQGPQQRYDAALQSAYGLTGIPDLQAAYTAATRGETLPAIGQGAAGLLSLAGLAAPLARGAIGAARMAAPAIGDVLADVSGSVPRMSLYRAGGPNSRASIVGDAPTFFSTAPEGAEPYATHGAEVAPYRVPVNNLFDVSQGDNAAMYRQFLDETGHPGRYGNNGNPFWTTEPELSQWLKSKGVPFDAIKFDENTGHPSIAYYGDDPVTTPVTAYHGSPHNFDQFDTNAIGTGEGAQVYGHGLYFADNEGIARSYRDRLGEPGKPLGLIWRDWAGGQPYNLLDPRINRDLLPNDLHMGANELYTRLSYYKPEAVTRDLLNDTYGNLTNTIQNYQAAHAEGRTLMSDNEMWAEKYNLERAEAAKKVLDLAGFGKNNPSFDDTLLDALHDGPNATFPSIEVQYPTAPKGRMYQVNIDTDPESLLHWDLPMNQQPEQVQAAALELAKRYPGATPEAPQMNWGEFQQNHLKPMQALFANALAGTPGEKFANQVAESSLLAQEPRPSTNLWSWDEMLDAYAPHARPAVEAELNRYRAAINPLNASGSDWYEALNRGITDANQAAYDARSGQPVQHINAADALAQQGIPGIRYLDANSRNAAGWHIIPANNSIDGKWILKTSDYNSTGLRFDTEADAKAALAEKIGPQSHNYVVFDDKIINILRKYGLAGLVAGGAYTLGGNANAATHAIPVEHDPFAP